MKSIKSIIILSALAALCLASCDKNEDVSLNNAAVRFTASIGKDAVDTPQTRAAGAIWTPGDNIGIFMVEHGSTTIASGAENKHHTTATGNGVFTPAAGHDIFYPMDNSAVDFIACYPYSNGATLATALAVEIPTTQTADTQSAADLMWARADNNGPGYTNATAATPVNFTFAHCLSKLTMNCQVDTKVGPSSLLDAAKVTIHGMNTRNTFDLRTGMLGTAPGTPANITPRRLSAAPTGFHGAYDAIIMPAAYAADKLKVVFTIDGEIFTWNLGRIEFKPGYEYIYEVLITISEIKVTATILPWTKKNKNTIYAE